MGVIYKGIGQEPEVQESDKFVIECQVETILNNQPFYTNAHIPVQMEFVQEGVLDAGETVNINSIFTQFSNLTGFTIQAPIFSKKMVLPSIDIDNIISQSVAFTNHAQLDGDYREIILDTQFVIDNNLSDVDDFATNFSITTQYNNSDKPDEQTASYTNEIGKLFVDFDLLANHTYKLKTYNSNLQYIQNISLVPDATLTFLVVPDEHYILFETTENVSLTFEVDEIATDVQNFNSITLESYEDTIREIELQMEVGKELTVGEQYRIINSATPINEIVFYAISKNSLQINFRNKLSDDLGTLLDVLNISSDLEITENCSIDKLAPLTKYKTLIKFYKR